MKYTGQLKNTGQRAAAKNGNKRFLLFSAAFLLGAAFLIVGIYRGEVAVVLKKAIYICLECIGIG